MRDSLLALNFTLMVAMPLALGLYLRHRQNLPWRIWFIGAATFIASQVGHIPFNSLVLRWWDPAAPESFGAQLLLFGFLGFSAGLFEEPARYLAYRFAVRDARSWRQGLMLGAGHGGIEAILLGLLGGINTFVVLTLARSEQLAAVVPLEQLAPIQAQLSALAALPAYQLLLGALERLFTIVFHLAASILVLQVFRRGQRRWLVAAIVLHGVANTGTLLAVTRFGPVAAEAFLGGVALFCLGVIFWLKTPEAAAPEPEPLPPPGVARPRLETSRENLDESRYL